MSILNTIFYGFRVGEFRGEAVLAEQRPRPGVDLRLPGADSGHTDRGKGHTV